MKDHVVVIKRGNQPYVVSEETCKMFNGQVFPEDCVQIVTREYEGKELGVYPDSFRFKSIYDEHIRDNEEIYPFVQELKTNPFYKKYLQDKVFGPFITHIPLSISWFGNTKGGDKIQFFYDYKWGKFISVIYDRHNGLFKAVEIFYHNGQYQCTNLSAMFDDMADEPVSDMPFVVVDNIFRKQIVYADLKGTDYAEPVKSFTANIMKNADPNMKKPLVCAPIVKGKKIPDKVLEIVKNLGLPENTYEEMIGKLVYDTWTHLNDDVNDLYAVRYNISNRMKCVTYKDKHLTKEDIKKECLGFDIVFNNMLEKAGDKTKLQQLVNCIASCTLGEDFDIFFDKKVEKLPDDIKNAFQKNAEHILADMKAVKKA